MLAASKLASMGEAAFDLSSKREREEGMDMDLEASNPVLAAAGKKRITHDHKGRKISRAMFDYRREHGMCVFCEEKGHRWMVCPKFAEKSGTTEK
jgi:hypothetical protein